jgi:hypothetical protein
VRNFDFYVSRLCCFVETFYWRLSDISYVIYCGDDCLVLLRTFKLQFDGVIAARTIRVGKSYADLKRALSGVRETPRYAQCVRTKSYDIRQVKTHNN